MTTQLNATVITGEKSHRPRWLGLACATALTAAAVAVLGVWQFRDQATVPSGEQVNQAGAPASATVGRAAAIEESVRPYLYLVDSDEQAAFLRRFSAEVNALRVQAGQQPAIVSVLVTEGFDPAILAELPGPPRQVVFDLRAR